MASASSTPAPPPPTMPKLISSSVCNRGSTFAQPRSKSSIGFAGTISARISGWCGHCRSRAHIDRDDVAADRTPVLHAHTARIRVQLDRALKNGGTAFEISETVYADVYIGPRIVSGHIARKHSRIGCVPARRHQSEPHRRIWPQAKTPQNFDMCMACANEHDMPARAARCRRFPGHRRVHHSAENQMSP